jgi:hypothetical protein
MCEVHANRREGALLVSPGLGEVAAVIRSKTAVEMGSNCACWVLIMLMAVPVDCFPCFPADRTALSSSV